MTTRATFTEAELSRATKVAQKTGMSVKITAVHGHASARTSEVYTKGYNRTALAEKAMARFAGLEW